MRTRRLAVLSLAVLALTGCADNAGGPASASGVAPGPSASGVTPGSSPSAGPASPTSVSFPAVVPSSGPVTVPSLPVRSASAPETISGTVSAGVEPHCLVLRDSKGSHVLVFSNPSLKASAPPGAEVTLVGHAEPTMMTTCQQGVVFIVTAVGKN